MAEKEDYIVISKKDFDYKKGHYVTHLAKQMTSQEAIEKMARVICKNRICAIECEKCELWRNFVVLANDCLNALLGGK